MREMQFLSAFMRVNPYFTSSMIIGFISIAAIGVGYGDLQPSVFRSGYSPSSLKSPMPLPARLITADTSSGSSVRITDPVFRQSDFWP